MGLLASYPVVTAAGLAAGDFALVLDVSDLAANGDPKLKLITVAELEMYLNAP